MAHENLKAFLNGEDGHANASKVFVSSLTRAVYSWADKVDDKYYNYRIFEELTIRYETDEKTRLGLDKQEHYRFDAVYFIQPGRRALNQHQCYTAGIELKNSKEDLMQDDKIVKYLEWTNFFFIGVPSHLIEDAKTKIQEIYKKYLYAKDLIGLMNVETGKIEILPIRQTISLANTCKMQEQVIYNVLFNDIKAVSFKLDDIEVKPAQFNANPIIDNLIDNSIIGNSILDNQAQDSTVETLSSQTETTSTKDAEYRKDLALRKAERLETLSRRGKELPTSTAAIYNALDPNSKEVFWGIVDACKSLQDTEETTNTTHQNITREILSKNTGLSLQKIDRSLVPLTEKGLISRDGGKKNGTYIVNVATDKTTSCESCKLYNQCQYVHSNEGCPMFQ